MEKCTFCGVDNSHSNFITVGGYRVPEGHTACIKEIREDGNQEVNTMIEHINEAKHYTDEASTRAISFETTHPDILARLLEVKETLGQLESDIIGKFNITDQDDEPQEEPKTTPFEYGQRAFQNGKPAAPALDGGFLENCIKGLQVGESLKPLEEWARGWHEANRKANLPGIVLSNGAVQLLRKPTDNPKIDIVLAVLDGQFVTWVYNKLGGYYSQGDYHSHGLQEALDGFNERD